MNTIYCGATFCPFNKDRSCSKAIVVMNDKGICYAVMKRDPAGQRNELHNTEVEEVEKNVEVREAQPLVGNSDGISEQTPEQREIGKDEVSGGGDADKCSGESGDKKE